MNTMKSCIDFANENKLCYVATIEKDQPRVRAMGFWFADETGFYFQTGDVKSLYRQLKDNPKVEVCFFKPDKMTGTTLRISGDAEFVNDRKLKEKVLAERPFLKSFGLTIDSPGLVIFRIPHGQAHYWTMDTNMKPKELISF
jgi:pyridoxamine 5'-phosphate oxidase